MKKIQYKILLLIFSTFSLTALLMISPLITFFSIAIIFIFLNIEDFKVRAPLSILGFLSGSAIYASRFVGNIYGDDVANEYYPFYQQIYAGKSIFDSEYAGGVEFGLPLYFKIMSILLHHLDQNGVIFCVSALCCLLFYIWIEFYFFKEIKIKHKTLLIASAFIFFGFFSTTQLMRQAISTVILLFFLFSFRPGSKSRSIIFLFISTIFHLTALLLSAVNYIFLYSSQKKKLILTTAFFFIGVLFVPILQLVVNSGLFIGITSKFFFYLDKTSNGIETAYYWKILLPICLFSFFFMKNQHANYKWFLCYSLISYLCLIQIPYAADRCFMLLDVYLLGIVIYFCFERIIGIYQILLFLFCIFRFLQLGPLYPTKCGNVALCLWGSYPWLGSFLG